MIKGIKEACEKLASSAIASAGIMAGIPGSSSIARLWQGYIEDKMAFDRDVANVMAATGMSHDEVMKATQDFPGSWREFCLTLEEIEL